MAGPGHALPVRLNASCFVTETYPEFGNSNVLTFKYTSRRTIVRPARHAGHGTE